MTHSRHKHVYCVEVTYKGETGYVGHFGFAPVRIFLDPYHQDVATYSDRHDADVAAEGLWARQDDAFPWDALTGVQVIELERRR